MRTTVAAAGEPLLVEVDGRAGSVSDVGKPGMLPRGHLTSAQVRDGAVRGLDLHLTRLAEAHEQLFGSALDTAAVHLLMARAVREHPDAYLRVTVDETPSGAPRVVTVVRPPLEAPTAPQSVAPTAYVRALPKVKHTGSYGQSVHGDAAVRKGYDDVLLIAPDGQLAETSVANIGFLRAGRVVWPSGPALLGITWQLLDLALAAAGTPTTVERIRQDDKRGFEGAFLSNSLGVAPVGRIGTHAFADPEASSFLVDLYAAVPWDEL